MPDSSFPGSVLDWILLLGAIYGALLAGLAVIEKALESAGKNTKVLRPYGGLIGPVGWAAWCIALICEHPGPVSVLIALAGVTAITIAGQRLAQNCKA